MKVFESKFDMKLFGSHLIRNLFEMDARMF